MKHIMNTHNAVEQIAESKPNQMTKQLKEPSKTAIRQAMRHRLGYSYRHINEYFNVRLENIWYSINGNCAIKWCNRSKAEQSRN